jgi:hypothetical protein
MTRFTTFAATAVLALTAGLASMTGAASARDYRYPMVSQPHFQFYVAGPGYSFGVMRHKRPHIMMHRRICDPRFEGPQAYLPPPPPVRYGYAPPPRIISYGY